MGNSELKFSWMEPRNIRAVQDAINKTKTSENVILRAFENSPSWTLWRQKELVHASGKTDPDTLVNRYKLPRVRNGYIPIPLSL